MAETVLSPAALAQIERDLDHLIKPTRETTRALVAEIRCLRADLVTARAEVYQLSAAIAQARRALDSTSKGA